MIPSTAKTIPTAEAGSKESRSHTPLPIRFRHDGFDYRQIAREGDAAIFQQTKPSTSICAYEVIRIRRRDGFCIASRLVEPAEVYPNSGAWGTDGFTLPDTNAAFAKLRELTGQGA